LFPSQFARGNHDNAGRLVSHDRSSLYVVRMVHRSRCAPKHHYGWYDPKAGRLDPDDDPVPLLEGGKSNLAGSRFNNSQTNREAVDGASHVPPKTGSGVSGEESEAAGLLSAYQPDHFVSGHDHAFPYKSGQGWNQRMGEVCVLGVSQTGTIQVPLRWDVSCFKR